MTNTSTQHWIIIVTDMNILNSLHHAVISADYNTMKPDLLLQESLEQLLAFFSQLVLHHLSGILRGCCGNIHTETPSNWKKKLQKVVRNRNRSAALLSGHTQHAAVLTTERLFRAKRETRDLWRAAFDQSVVICKCALVVANQE